MCFSSTQPDGAPIPVEAPEIIRVDNKIFFFLKYMFDKQGKPSINVNEIVILSGYGIALSDTAQNI